MHDRSRRTVLGAGLVAGAAAMGAFGTVASPAREAATGTLGTLADFEMPIESARHERTFMQWPVSLDVYGPKQLRAVQKEIALIANTISRYEPVVMLVGARHAAAARAQLGDGVVLWDIATDDLWCRDSGPTFVVDSAGKLAVADFHFNAWGNKQPHANDARIAAQVAKRLGVSLLDTGLVGEAGGVEHNGAGTLLAHASCWANANRNSASQAEIGDLLLDALGGKKMIWAPGIRGADITDYHIDALARFVAPGKLLIQLPEAIDPADPWSKAAYQTYDLLKRATDAQGQPIDIVIVAEPVDIRATAKDFVASYVNYYACNGAVISAQFGDVAADAAAQALLAKLYPGREIVSLNIDAIGGAGGGIHCATQQQPATA